MEDVPFEAPSHWFYFQGWTESSKQKIRGRTEGGGRENTMDGWIHLERNYRKIRADRDLMMTVWNLRMLNLGDSGTT